MGISAATGAHWMILALQLPAFTWITGWFWPLAAKRLQLEWVLLALIPCLVAVPTLRLRGRSHLQVFLFLLFGLAMQFGFGFSEGRGIEGISSRMRDTGHATFAVVAARQPSIVGVMRNYGNLARYDKLGDYAKTKPPGQLLTYMFAQRLANRLFPRTGHEQRLATLRLFASYTWPVISYLVLLPLFYLGKLLFDERIGLLACALYVFVPAVDLITLHTDQVLFPLVFVSSLLLATLAIHKRRFAVSLSAGCVAYVGVYCSFGLAYVIPVGIAICIVFSRTKGRTPGSAYWPRVVLGFLLGVLVLDVANRLVFGYDIWAGYKYAIAHHFASKGYPPTAGNIGYYGFSNVLEHMIWTGIPIYFLTCLGMVRAVRAVMRRQADTGALLSFVLLGLISTLVVFGRTSSEIARLWLFLVPLFCMLAADEISKRFSLSRHWVITLVVVLQWGTVYLTKHYQDFY